MHPKSCLQLCTSWSPKRAVVSHGEQVMPRSGTIGRTCVCTKPSRLGNPVVRSRPDPARGAVSEPSVAERLQQRANSVMDYSPLLLVSALWGSYTPVLRYLYSMDPLLTPQVLTAHRTVISAVALLAASAATIGYKAYTKHQQLQQARQELLQQQLEQQQLEQQQLQQHWQHRIIAGLPEWMQHLGRGRQPQNEDSSSTSDSNAAAATASAAAVLAAGLELGVWNFLGTSSQAIGLELSTATKAAFLTQTTAVITPCLAALCGQAVLPAHWVACFIALLGSCCITLDSLLATQSLHQVIVAQPPQQQVAAVSGTQDAACTSSNSSSSSSVVKAPPLADATTSSSGASSSSASFWASQQQQQEGQQMAAITADRLTLDIATGDCGSSEATSSSGLAVTVPAVTCSPAATPPQGVVPAIACAPVTAASSSNSSSGSSGNSAEGGGPTELLDSSSIAKDLAGSEAQQQQQQQQQQDHQQQDHQQVSFAPFAEQEQKGTTSSSSSSSSWSGEMYILLACCCYAIATVRLSMLAPGLDPVQLATSKTLTLAAASLCWLLAFQDGSVTPSATAAASATSDAVSAAVAAADAVSVKAAVAAALHSAAEKWQLPDAFTHGSGMLLLFYSALGPGALAAVMQAKGQAATSAAEAQVFYSLTPVMAALLAALFLQGEEMGPLAWLGGSVIVAASVGTALAGHAGSNGDDSTSNTEASSSGSSRDGEASSSNGSSSLLASLRQRTSSSNSSSSSSGGGGGGGGGGLIGGIRRRTGIGSSSSSSSSSRGSSKSSSRSSSPTV